MSSFQANATASSSTASIASSSTTTTTTSAANKILVDDRDIDNLQVEDSLSNGAGVEDGDNQHDGEDGVGGRRRTAAKRSHEAQQHDHPGKIPQQKNPTSNSKATKKMNKNPSEQKRRSLVDELLYDPQDDVDAPQNQKDREDNGGNKVASSSSL